MLFRAEELLCFLFSSIFHFRGHLKDAITTPSVVLSFLSSTQIELGFLTRLNIVKEGADQKVVTQAHSSLWNVMALIEAGTEQSRGLREDGWPRNPKD